MPSATAAGHVLSNLGPLTAVFTPAPSCAAQQTNVYVGPRRQPNLPGYYINCADLNVLGRNGCVPSGAALDAQNTTPGAKPINYHSPGLACPTGWTTAGVMARGGPTEGVFQKPSDFDELFATTSIGAIPNPAVNVLMGVLEAGETAVVCCPSSMVADGMYGNCYSILTSFPVSACIRSADKSGQVGLELTALSIYGTTATIRTFSYNTNIPITATRTTVFSSQDQTALQAATYVPMVTLINRGETLGGAPRPGGSARARVPWAFLVAMAMAVSTLA